jgi:hypothetical protein
MAVTGLAFSSNFTTARFSLKLTEAARTPLVLFNALVKLAAQLSQCIPSTMKAIVVASDFCCCFCAVSPTTKMAMLTVTASQRISHASFHAFSDCCL